MGAIEIVVGVLCVKFVISWCILSAYDVCLFPYLLFFRTPLKTNVCLTFAVVCLLSCLFCFKI